MRRSLVDADAELREALASRRDLRGHRAAAVTSGATPRTAPTTQTPAPQTPAPQMPTSPPTRGELPEVVRSLCDAHATLVDDALPGLLDGLYLHGSIGFGGEFHGGSDVDFVAMITRRLTGDDIEALRRIHAELIRLRPAPAYDGFYLLETDLAGRPEDLLQAPGILHQWFSEEPHSDVKAITWRELRDHGITLRGKDLREIEIRSDDAELLASTRENLDTYWRSQLEAWSTIPARRRCPRPPSGAGSVRRD